MIRIMSLGMFSSTPACCLHRKTTGSHSWDQRETCRPCLRGIPASGPKATVKATGSNLRVLCRALKARLQERSSAYRHGEWHPAKALSSCWCIESTHALKHRAEPSQALHSCMVALHSEDGLNPAPRDHFAWLYPRSPASPVAALPFFLLPCWV